MKKTTCIFLISALLSSSVYCAENITVRPNNSVISEINKPLEKEIKLKTGDWIWISVLVVVGITFGSMAWNTKTPLNN